jgi:hypothetical protein
VVYGGAQAMERHGVRVVPLQRIDAEVLVALIAPT